MKPESAAERGRCRRVSGTLLICCLGLALAGCGDGPSAKAGAERMVPAVEAVQARRGTLPLTQRLSGVVVARNQVEIHPEISAVVTAVLVHDGDAVTAGQPLVRLRDTEFEKRLGQARANLRITVAQLRRAEAQAKEARADYLRLQALVVESLASTADLESGEARAESAEAEIELAAARVDQARNVAEEEEANLARTVIRAPFDGHVGSRDAEAGMLAGPSTRLLTIGQLDSVRVQVILTDRMLNDISEGQRAEILLDGGPLSAPLARISPFLHPISHTTEAEIDLPNPDGRLRPGMFVGVDVFYGESDEATLVPLSAIYEHPALGITGIYVATDEVSAEPTTEMQGAGTAFLSAPIGFRFVPVDMVAEGRLEAAVRSVADGDWVVTLGQNLLGGDKASARVRPVSWQRVERLQGLQREDMMRELNERRTPAVTSENH